MTPQQIRDAISADPGLQAVKTSSAALAELPPFSTHTTLASRKIGTGTILAAFAGVGGQFLDLLEQVGASDRDIHWLLSGNILRGDFDVGESASQVGLSNLIAAMPALVVDETLREQFVTGLNALMAMGYASTPVPEIAIRRAIFADDGSLLV